MTHNIKMTDDELSRVIDCLSFSYNQQSSDYKKFVDRLRKIQTKAEEKKAEEKKVEIKEEIKTIFREDKDLLPNEDLTGKYMLYGDNLYHIIKQSKLYIWLDKYKTIYNKEVSRDITLRSFGEGYHKFRRYTTDIIEKNVRILKSSITYAHRIIFDSFNFNKYYNYDTYKDYSIHYRKEYDGLMAVEKAYRDCEYMRRLKNYESVKAFAENEKKCPPKDEKYRTYYQDMLPDFKLELDRAPNIIQL
jgi:hypothetical protein